MELEKMQKKELIEVITDLRLDRDNYQSALYQGKREVQKAESQSANALSDSKVLEERLCALRQVMIAAAAVKHPNTSLGGQPAVSDAPRVSVYPTGAPHEESESEDLLLLRHLYHLTFYVQ